jgi:hypothetical protein
VRRERIQPILPREEILRMTTPWSEVDYHHPHLANCPNQWTTHNVAIALGMGFGKVASLADLSCGGDAYVPRKLAEYSDIDPLLGDVPPGFQYEGMYHETVPELPHVELFVSTHTLEHLDDPESDLTLIRGVCDKLLLSTPVDEWTDHGPDHYWAWDREAVEEIIKTAGFEISAYVEFDPSMHWYPHKTGNWALR